MCAPFGARPRCVGRLTLTLTLRRARQSCGHTRRESERAKERRAYARKSVRAPENDGLHDAGARPEQREDGVVTAGPGQPEGGGGAVGGLRYESGSGARAPAVGEGSRGIWPPVEDLGEVCHYAEGGETRVLKQGPFMCESGKLRYSGWARAVQHGQYIYGHSVDTS